MIFCTNKQIMVHYILQPRHIFIHIKAFILMLVRDGVQLLTCIIVNVEWAQKIVPWEFYDDL